jgi:hypothetical protein
LKKLVMSDLVPPRLYEPIRDELRKKVIEAKRWRRVAVGDNVTVVFENRTTMRFQVQEMLRAESIVDPAKIQDELDVYNQLLPDEGQLAATLFVEIVDEAAIKPTLQQLVGLDEHVKLLVGAEVVRADFESGRSEEDRISSVLYLRFKLSTPQQSLLKRPVTALALVVDHPSYRHRIELAEETRASLAADLD